MMPENFKINVKFNFRETYKMLISKNIHFSSSFQEKPLKFLTMAEIFFVHFWNSKVN